MGQLEAVYNDTISNWRYVRDPANMEAVTVSPPEIMEFTLGFNADGTRSMGTGDCDDITIALGALLNAIGFETRIVTSTDPARPKNWSHVFIQALVPEVGWVTVDPVLYPDLPFASTVETTRLGYWDLNGAYQYAENLAGCMAGCNTSLAGQRKYSYDGQIYEGEEILPFESIHSLGGEFGCEIERLGYIGNANCWNIELMPEDYISATEAITPVIAVSPQDFEYLSVVGFPYEGMKAVGNTGYIYEFTKNRDGLHGPVIDFFKGIGRAIKKGFNKVVSFVKGAVSWAWDKVENVFEATKVGRWILNVKDRVLDFAVQVITPLAEFVGKWAPAAASIAAVVPGVGTLVSMGILATGAAAKAYVKWGVPIVNTIIEIDGEEVEVPVPEFV
ncbi:MAG: transglutaminase domain-containing protein, partial [Phycisphaerae bacterium]|nr:transglutaminase domain-containing protein [Phycisphaerae bacterium]